MGITVSEYLPTNLFDCCLDEGYRPKNQYNDHRSSSYSHETGGATVKMRGSGTKRVKSRAAQERRKTTRRVRVERESQEEPRKKERSYKGPASPAVSKRAMLMQSFNRTLTSTFGGHSTTPEGSKSDAPRAAKSKKEVDPKAQHKDLLKRIDEIQQPEGSVQYSMDREQIQQLHVEKAEKEKRKQQLQHDETAAKAHQADLAAQVAAMALKRQTATTS